MKKINILIIVILFNCLSQIADAQTTYLSAINSIKSPQPDLDNIYKVRDIVLMRDAAAISLDSGTIFFYKPINGKIKLGVFIGKGTLNYRPPFDVEIRQLKRIMKKEMIMDGFDKLVLFFDDSTFYDIAPYSEKATTTNIEKANSLVQTFIDYEIFKNNNFFDTNIGNILFSKSNSEAFYSLFTTENNGTLFFSIDPKEMEEVALCKGSWHPVAGKTREPINQFFSANHSTQKQAKETNDIIAIESYKINTNISSDLSMKCKSTLCFKILCDYVQWVPMHLTKDLSISSLTLQNSEKVEYHQSDDATIFWLKLPDNLKKDDSITINIEYSGTIISRIYDFIFLKTSTGWYPKYGNRNLANFELTFEYPDNYNLVSIGNEINKKKNDGRIISLWKTDYKVRNASFNLGPYEIDRYKPNDSIKVDLLYITSDKHKNVGNDLMLSVDFFTKLFGRLPIEKLYATELPAGHGEAFPGLLHLSDEAFRRGSDDGFWELFVSHEVSHQWWGITVDFESYRDQWLSEGFAVYSSLMYLQTILQDNEKFLGYLVKYRKELLETRRTFISNGIEPGPISLGYRNNTDATEGDYQLIIYKKGAWIFHMLRNIFLNINTMNEDAFISLLRELYSEYKLKRLSTKQFRDKVEKIAGIDFSWFFEQWVDNYNIPKYTFATKTEIKEDGNYRVKCKVKQDNVPPSFKMIVPIKITLDGDKEIRLRTFITGAVSEFELPPLAEKPEKITFNDLESVLCEVEYSDWE